MRKSAVLRIRFITGAILILAFLLLGRLYQLQVLRTEAYQEQAESQYVHTVRDLYSRGSIFMTTVEGERVSAATIQSGYLLSIDPARLDDPENVYTKLNEIVPLEHDVFIERASRTSRRYQEIAQRVSEQNAEKIEALNLTGVQLYRNQWRYYPGKSLEARTFGFVGYTEDKLSGLYGLERYYDNVLYRDNERLSVNFFAEIFSNLGSFVFDKNEEEEGDIVTSIEPTVARMLDKVLEGTQQKWSSKLTGGIIIDPRSGDIYALDAVPTFNLNDRTGVEIGQFRNPLVENVYEFGSIFKALTMAAGLDSNTVTPTTMYNDTGHITVDGYTISNYDGRARGRVSMQEVLNQSLNVGASHVATLMGKDTFRKYFLGLKLGTEAGIDLPNETYGLVNNLQSPRQVEYDTASFGQGIAVTPIEMARALSTLANGGQLVTPHIVQEIDFENGTTNERGYPPGEHVFSEETGETITRMLVTVVDDALGGGDVALPNYTIAAKTGTAQIADEENGGYYDDRYLHSFFGYFPAYDPKFLVFLYTVEPKGVRYASETLTDPFMELTRFLINYYDIPPDR